MGVTNSNKVINTDRILCDGALRVTLALTAAPDIVSNPTDIVLVLDRSGSMTGSPLADMKLGANTFIDLIDEATDSTKDGQIGSGSRMGVVSFSSTAVANTQLITSVDALKTAVDGLSAGGSTNHADAFAKATQLFDPASPNAKGSYSHLEQCVYVRPGMSQTQTLKTLIHEIAHAKLHALPVENGVVTSLPEKDRHTREVEAESVAYVVCQHFGVDTSDYSFGYVAGWSRGREMEELKASLECIRTTAADLIDGIESRCPELFPKPAKQEQQKKRQSPER